MSRTRKRVSRKNTLHSKTRLKRKRGGTLKDRAKTKKTKCAVV